MEGTLSRNFTSDNVTPVCFSIMAAIIDARRHPLGCCLSGFRQHFARGQNFSCGLEDISRYYRDYVQLMAHVDAVLPGRAYRVFYESTIESAELEVRRVLDCCGLDSRSDACGPRRTNEPCAPRVQSRYGSRFSRTA
jgi:hypothetical protein